MPWITIILFCVRTSPTSLPLGSLPPGQLLADQQRSPERSRGHWMLLEQVAHGGLWMGGFPWALGRFWQRRTNNPNACHKKAAFLFRLWRALILVCPVLAIMLYHVLVCYTHMCQFAIWKMSSLLVCSCFSFSVNDAEEHKGMLLAAFSLFCRQTNEELMPKVLVLVSKDPSTKWSFCYHQHT